MPIKKVRDKLIESVRLAYIGRTPYRRDNRVLVYCLADEEERERLFDEGGLDSLKIESKEVMALSKQKDGYYVGIAEGPNHKPYASEMSESIKIIGYCYISKKSVLEAFDKKRMSEKMMQQAKDVLTDVICWSYSDERPKI